MQPGPPSVTTSEGVGGVGGEDGEGGLAVGGGALLRGHRSGRGQGRDAGLAVGGEDVVRLLAHERDERAALGEVDGLGGDVGLGRAAAVPVEVVAAGTPAAPVVLTDR